ncbi:MAG: hypothetical protein I8H75_01525 [Myxococcaceae bacterium]|nr:hypothetical protein [Myxococcaceae bacterium]MBH2006019.1 hypothetical protein [Myxococcaceae bacterium]
MIHFIRRNLQTQDPSKLRPEHSNTPSFRDTFHPSSIHRNSQQREPAKFQPSRIHAFFSWLADRFNRKTSKPVLKPSSPISAQPELTSIKSTPNPADLQSTIAPSKAATAFQVSENLRPNEEFEKTDRVEWRAPQDPADITRFRQHELFITKSEKDALFRAVDENKFEIVVDLLNKRPLVELDYLFDDQGRSIWKAAENKAKITQLLGESKYATWGVSPMEEQILSEAFKLPYGQVKQNDGREKKNYEVMSEILGKRPYASDQLSLISAIKLFLQLRMMDLGNESKLQILAKKSPKNKLSNGERKLFEFALKNNDLDIIKKLFRLKPAFNFRNAIADPYSIKNPAMRKILGLDRR